MDCKKILVIVPHGDDEVLLCGGTISRYVREGNEVTVAFIRAANDARTQHQLDSTYKAKDVLGYQRIIHINLPEEDITNNFILLKTNIEALVQHIKPHCVITTFYNDNHQDHRNTFRAVSVATRHHFAPFIEQILVGEINSSTEQAIGSEQFTPNYFIRLEKQDLANKCKAMLAYDTEAKEAPHPRSFEGICALGMVRGMRIGVPSAEAFMILKQVY